MTPSMNRESVLFAEPDQVLHIHFHAFDDTIER